ncbi:MAG: Ig-like domain-containing protein [Mucilaginibacter sp.]|nr:Ig-like domain-containing protein [Mucilaginibacter sp.]
MRKNILLLFVCLLGAASFVSCKKKDEPKPIVLQSISLSQDTLTMRVGDATHISYTITPVAYGKKSLVWSSSDPTIVAVTDSGTFTAKKVGSAIITLGNGDHSVTANLLITVLDKIPPVDSLKVGLLAYYPFDNSGDDFSGNENHGSVFNITSAVDRRGNVNGAYHFDGVSSYIAVPDNQALRLGNTSFTLNAWVKLDSYNSSFGCNILTKHFTGANNGWAWGITGNSYVLPGITTFGTGGGSASARGTHVVNINQWHMVTSVYNASTQQVSIYVDGVLDNVTSSFPSPNGSINATLYIGRDDPSEPTNGYSVNGSLDDVRIYTRALSINDIQKLYTN